MAHRRLAREPGRDRAACSSRTTIRLRQAYQKGLFEQGIPAASFRVEDIRAEHERLSAFGVRFTMEPTEWDGVFMAVFDDTCGNLIQIVQQ